MVKIIVDCFGGDKSPGANVLGAVNAVKKNEDICVILTGDEALIRAEVEKAGYSGDRIVVVHAPDVIGCDEKPTDAIKQKTESSMMKGVNMLREDDGIAGFVTTGSSGAAIAAGTLRVGRLKNVSRPAFCPIMPTMAGGFVCVVDSGANVDCTPERLYQFAVMGSIYMKCMLGIESPRVALLNVGTEKEKGDALRKEAYELIEADKSVNFLGNMESRDLISGKYDVVVCDGFSGNVLVKATEGACIEVLKRLKRDIFSSLRNKIGGLFLSSTLKKEKRFFDYRNYGGSIILGTKKIMVKGHGSSTEVSVEKSIEQVYTLASNRLNEKIEEALDKAQ
ncbi:MAG: phosphate acyltransferase PlsX [Clostridia bacterium]|nr:phosphate acyltransferase PlsX [Clostridia bacterium]